MNDINRSGDDFFASKYDFNTVPLLKIVILFTLCPFLIFWRSYRWWQKVAVDYNYRIYPFWRSSCMFIYNFPLFRIIEKHANEHNVKFIIGANWLALWYIVAPIVLGFVGYDNLIIDLICCYCLAFPYIYVQYKINEVNKKAYPNAEVEEWDIWDTVLSVFSLLSKIAREIDRK